MTARDDMTAAGLRVLDLLTMAEAAPMLPRGHRSVPAVRRLADEGVLERVRFGRQVRITRQSVAAYNQRHAS